MTIQPIKDPKWKAKCKYKRVRTLVKLCAEVSALCGVEINLMVYTDRGRRLQQSYTSDDMSIENLTRLFYNQRMARARRGPRKLKTLNLSSMKIDSRHAVLTKGESDEGTFILKSEPASTLKISPISKRIVKSKASFADHGNSRDDVLTKMQKLRDQPKYKELFKTEKEPSVVAPAAKLPSVSSANNISTDLTSLQAPSQKAKETREARYQKYADLQNNELSVSIGYFSDSD